MHALGKIGDIGERHRLWTPLTHSKNKTRSGYVYQRMAVADAVHETRWQL
jgi:hypothetical protein